MHPSFDDKSPKIGSSEQHNQAIFLARRARYSSLLDALSVALHRSKEEISQMPPIPESKAQEILQAFEDFCYGDTYY